MTTIKLDTYCDEWRRITEARWYLRECRNQRDYISGVTAKRGEAGAAQLMRDARLLMPHMNNFTKRVAADLIEQLKQEKEHDRQNPVHHTNWSQDRLAASARRVA